MMKCKSCERRFVNDNTPLGNDGYCLMCRSSVPVTCIQCGASCFGKPDGQLKCGGCRHKRYMKDYVWIDPTGGRLTRLKNAGCNPMDDPEYSYE